MRCFLSIIAVALLRLIQADFAISQSNLPQSNLPQSSDEKSAAEFFESKVRPILIDRCQSCHGEAKSWAGLRLDSAEALKRGGESGAAVSPGKPEESELFRRIASEDAGEKMPPPDSGKKLSPIEIEQIKEWIASGAVWPASAASTKPATSPHWAFQPVAHRDPPAAAVGESAHPIDRFIAARRRELNLPSSPRADLRTLIRRATYDLHGLPPSLAEVAAFTASSDPNAYTALVDRLLQSPRYGEQWGRHWLDLARYSDTKGYVYAREEREFFHASHYRDWVVQAFQDDMPYDRFVLLQLAADQAAKDEPKHLAAMGFLTLGRRFLGVESDVIDDKIDVVGRGLLGLTIGCARCHDHKYDPIPTADYYSLYGVFQSCYERVSSLPHKNGAAPDEKYLAGLQEREKKLAEFIGQKRSEAEGRLRARLGEYLYAQRELEKYPDASFNTFTNQDDIIPGLVIRWELFLDQIKDKKHPILDAWLAFAALNDEEFAPQAPATSSRILQEPHHHPKIAALFQTPPVSAKEVAERYGKLFGEIDQKWQKAIADAKAAGAPPPTALNDPQEETLRQFLYDSNSPCTIPSESVGNTEWCWDLNTVVELWKHQAELDRWLIGGQETDPRAVYLVDAPLAITPRIFKRGNPANKGPSVPRHFLTAIAGAEPAPFASGSGRLELAQAIVDPKNPLTARVWVNRVWRYHFGEGLVTSTSDFGLRASPPSHPELLDWLAAEFIAHGWSNRWLHKTIMTSETYQQSSRGPTDLAALGRAREIDPQNRYLWRMSTKRLSWEELRDSLLSFSQELDDAMGGKSVEMFAAGANGKFRRSVYNRIDRQYLPTLLSAFDFANPDMHSPQRSDTTIPQQALFLLNHPFVADRAKAIAKHSTEAAPDSEGDAIKKLFGAILQRSPTEAQLQSAIAFVEKAKQSPAAAPSLTPLEQLAQVLLISNEVLFVD